LNVIHLIHEPTAAAIFTFDLYRKKHEKKDENEHTKKILVLHLGGGTFDVSFIQHDSDRVLEVLATNGYTNLGGKDFDQRVMEYFIELFKNKTGKDVRKDNRAVQKLRHEVEKVKQILSSQDQAKIEIESFFDNEDFSETLTRAKFEELNMDLFRSTMKPVQKVLEDSDLKKSDIAEVVLVGGSTRIPKVQQLVKEFFDGKEPSRGINPDEAVGKLKFLL
jgi:heat shock protein 5